MKEGPNIEKLVKDTFEHFEADVNPNAWSNIQSGMNAASGSAASAGAKLAVGKIVAGAVSVALISGSIWYFAASENKTVPQSVPVPQNENTSRQDIAVVSSDEPSSSPITNSTNTGTPSQANDSWQAPPAARTLNQYHTEQTGQQPRTVSKANEQTDASDVSAPDNDPSSQPSKYGNATKGDGGMIRGIQGTSSQFSNSQTSSETPSETADARSAAISVSTSFGDAPLTVDFYNQGVASSLAWDFGDGTSSRENAPKHTFEKPGTYTVKLIAKNSSGSSSDIVTIEVRPISSITYVPNVFTPNGDGDNDNFFFEMKNIVSVGVAIYSQREGKQVYTSNSLDGKWNGKLMNGQDAPQGTYLYSIQAHGADGVIHSKKGFVELIIKQ